MLHIRQKNSSLEEGKSYTIVYTKNWKLPLSQHPSILEKPNVFEIVDIDPPYDVQYLVYQSNEESLLN